MLQSLGSSKRWRTVHTCTHVWGRCFAQMATVCNNQEYLQFLPYVGKGSKFKTHYVNSFNSVSNSNESHDDHELRSRQQKLTNYKKISKYLSQDELFQLNQEFIQQIFSLITSFKYDPKILDPKTVQEFYRQPRVLSMAPKLPESLNIEVFTDYVNQITNNRYVHNHASNEENVIPMLLRQFFHKDNRHCMKLRGIQSYNNVIRFFLSKNDLPYAKSLLAQMRSEGIRPNRLTYNLFIGHLRNMPVHYTNPLITVLKYLGLMRKEYISPDSTTWHLLYQILPDKISKQMLLDKMDQLGFSRTTLLTRFRLESLSSSAEMMKLLESTPPTSKDINCFNILFSQLVTEKKYHKCWELLHKITPTPNLSTLNSILNSLRNNSRVDLCFLFYNYMLEKFKISPNTTTFHYLIAAAVKQGFHNNWRQVLRILYHEMSAVTGTTNNFSGYYLQRAKARSLIDLKNNQAPLNLKAPLSAAELNIRHQLFNDLSINTDTKKFPTIPNTQKHGPKFVKATLTSGYHRAKPSKNGEPKENYIQLANRAKSVKSAIQKDFKQKDRMHNLSRRYRDRISIIKEGYTSNLKQKLVDNNMVSVPYLK
ncbi:BA75_01372T0 [Komagataella pastoris]|uniref:Mitochondrial 15S rRNA processing factor CCM1 n=1 Tax=Komagataella pastoris TaxID=4922 RepID=A0A1B2J8B3_PICPA|nr:BA75_01372T0 [Komagataella pastoris]